MPASVPGDNMVDIIPIRSKYPLDILSAGELAAVQAGTLQVLDQVGVRFPSKRALQIFADHGASVDWDNSVVRLSPDLVQGSMTKAPRVYSLKGRSPGSNLVHLAETFGADPAG